jgi:hypothetical protein
MHTLPAAAVSANPVRRALAAMEPWYDWGRTNILAVKDDAEGDGRFFSLDWFGLHVTIFYGRTPAKREG